MLKTNNTFLIVIFLFLYQCGFKVIDYSKLNNFNLKDIVTEGENRINYKLKNYVQSISNNNSNNNIILNIKSESKNSIKEKNSKNEVTKYQVEITSTINYKIINSEKTDNFKLTINGDYPVASKYSETQKNQEQLIENLTRKLSSDIKKELSRRLNDI